MEQNIDYFNPIQVSKFAEMRANKTFFELKDYLEQEGGVTTPSAGYELMELAYKIRNVIIQNDSVGTFKESVGNFIQNNNVELEKEILLHNIEYGLYSMALKRFRQGLPLVLEANKGFGPNKDFVDVVKIGLDRYPGNTTYPMGRTNHYGVDDKDIRLSEYLLYEVNPRAKTYTTQKVYYTPQAELLTEAEYTQKTGSIHTYRGHIADIEDSHQSQNPPAQLKDTIVQKADSPQMSATSIKKSSPPKQPQQQDGQGGQQ